MSDEIINDLYYTKDGKVKYPYYKFKLKNSVTSEITELYFEDVKKIEADLDENGKPNLKITYLDQDFELVTSLFNGSIETERIIKIL